MIERTGESSTAHFRSVWAEILCGLLWPTRSTAARAEDLRFAARQRCRCCGRANRANQIIESRNIYGADTTSMEEVLKQTRRSRATCCKFAATKLPPPSKRSERHHEVIRFCRINFVSSDQDRASDIHSSRSKTNSKSAIDGRRALRMSPPHAPSCIAGHLPRQSDGEHEHRERRLPQDAAHSKKYRRPACRSSRFDFADAVRRERPFLPRARSLDRESRSGNARMPDYVHNYISKSSIGTEWNFYCHRPDRFRKNDDALFLLAPSINTIGIPIAHGRRTLSSMGGGGGGGGEGGG